MAKNGDPPCQAEACSLQSCLNRNTYSPEKCQRHVKDLYRCCKNLYDMTNDKGQSTACPIPSVVRRWLKDHEDI